MPYLYGSPPLPTTNTAPSHKMGFNIFRRKSSRLTSSATADPQNPSRKPTLTVLSRERDTEVIPTYSASHTVRMAPSLHVLSSPVLAQPPAYGSRMTPLNDPPPAYEAAAQNSAPQTDSPYGFLRDFDTIFLIDDSGSMAGANWRETGDAIAAIAPVCTQHDEDGIDIYFLNADDTFRNVKDAHQVAQIFHQVKAGGGTPTGQRLNSILSPYLLSLERKGKHRLNGIKPLNIIVITDGEAYDDPESVIVSCARRLERLEAPAWQVGIQFFQVGRSKDATMALKELDDELVMRGCPRDIVDTVPWRGDDGRVGLNADQILKCCLGAVNRRLDRRRVSGERPRA